MILSIIQTDHKIHVNKDCFYLHIYISPVCNTSYSKGLCNSEIRFLNNIVACLPIATALKHWEPLNVSSYKHHKSPQNPSQIYCVHDIAEYYVLQGKLAEREAMYKE